MIDCPTYKDDFIVLYNIDCFTSDFLSSLESDHCITDPPYSAHVHNNSLKSANIKNNIGYDHITENEIANFAKLINVKKWLLIFGDVESTHLWRNHFENYQKYEYVRTGAAIKPNPMPQLSGDRPAVGFKAISIFHNKSVAKSWNGGGKPALWKAPLVQGKDRYQEGQKAISLMLELIENFTNSGDSILDPFVGSGTTLLAAKRLSRKAIGIEKDKQRFLNACSRLAQTSIFE